MNESGLRWLDNVTKWGPRKYDSKRQSQSLLLCGGCVLFSNGIWWQRKNNDFNWKTKIKQKSCTFYSTSFFFPFSFLACWFIKFEAHIKNSSCDVKCDKMPAATRKKSIFEVKRNEWLTAASRCNLLIIVNVIEMQKNKLRSRAHLPTAPLLHLRLAAIDGWMKTFLMLQHRKCQTIRDGKIPLYCDFTKK